MTTPIWITGFEHGILSANGGGIVNTISGTAPTVIAGAARTGGYGLRHTVTAATGYVSKTISGTPNVMVTRLYIKFITLPAATVNIITHIGPTVTHALRFNFATTKFMILHTSTVDVGPVLTTGVWYRVDFVSDNSAASDVTKCQIDGGTEQTVTVAADATRTFTSMRIGFQVSSTAEMYVDDICVSATLADYPIGSGEVQKLAITGDGTHSPATPDCIRGGGASPALISGSNFAFQYMDEVPFPSGTSPTTDRINQDITAGHTTHYVEITTSGAPSGTINGVSGVLAYGGDSATANSGSTVVNNSEASETIIYGSSATPADMSEITVFYKSEIITKPSGGWSAAELNALKLRIGYSGDITPNPYWQAFLYEVDLAPGAGSAFLPKKININQAVNRASTY